MHALLCVCVSPDLGVVCSEHYPFLPSHISDDQVRCVWVFLCPCVFQVCVFCLTARFLQFKLGMYYSAIQAVSVLAQMWITRTIIARTLNIDVFRLVWWLLQSESVMFFELLIVGLAFIPAVIIREAHLLFFFAPWYAHAFVCSADDLALHVQEQLTSTHSNRDDIDEIVS